MKIAVVSDIHGNLEALDAVLSDMEAYRVDKIVCLGDLIGYGPDPEAVVSKVAKLGMICLQGNHEAALQSEKALAWLNFLARENNIATKTLLSEHIYEEDADRDSNVIEVFIGRLRRKIDPHGKLNPIETLRGRGYRLNRQS